MVYAMPTWVQRAAPVNAFAEPSDSLAELLSGGLAFGGVVAFAGEDFVVVLGDVDFDFAKFAVAGIVGGVVAKCVLAAKFLGDLIEGFLKVLFVVGDNQAAACFFGHLFRDAGVAAE